MRCLRRSLVFLLSLCVALPAAAVHLGADGTGQVLLYPYYTTNADNNTLISVVNSTANAKALKVRFYESRNGRATLNFNLYLGAYDVWTAGIFSLGSGAASAANLATVDSSCTAPAIQNNTTLPITPGGGLRYMAFSDLGFTGANNDSDSNTLDRTREGYLEIFEMGTIVAGSATDNALAAFAPGSLGKPVNCDRIGQSFQADGSYGSTQFGTLASDIGPPSGGLYGTGAIINIALGTYINYNATALEAFRSTVLHTTPIWPEPNLANADPVSTVLTADRVIRSTWGSEKVGLANGVGQRIDAVSSVLMAANLSNEFSTESSIGAASEWVITMPTKRFYSDSVSSGSLTAIAPFTVPFNVGAPANITERQYNACEAIAPTMYSRAQEILQPTTMFQPPAPPTLQNSPYLCASVAVIAFNQETGSTFHAARNPSKILGAVNGQAFQTRSELGLDAQSGQVDLKLGSSLPLSTNASRVLRASSDSKPRRFVGLPIIGFWALSIENNSARPGVQGYYGGAFEHKRVRLCVSGAGLDEACESQ
jgi:hypothetical protein